MQNCREYRWEKIKQESNSRECGTMAWLHLAAVKLFFNLLHYCCLIALDCLSIPLLSANWANAVVCHYLWKSITRNWFSTVIRRYVSQELSWGFGAFHVLVWTWFDTISFCCWMWGKINSRHLKGINGEICGLATSGRYYDNQEMFSLKAT